MFVCCIVKPSAQHLCTEIRSALTIVGLPILCEKEVTYTAALVDVLYDHMSREARTMIAQRYGGCTGTALLLYASSIEACLAVCGKESDPRACTLESIRGRYGSRGDFECLGDWPWWENAIHRPVDERERARDVSLFFPEYAEGAG